MDAFHAGVISLLSWHDRVLRRARLMMFAPSAARDPGRSDRSDEMVRRTFNLRLWFAICSLGTIALICVTSAHFLTQFMTNSLLAREGKLSQEFLESLATFNGDDIFDDLNDPAAPKNPRLLDFAQRVLHVSGVVRVNIYAKTHRVLWSTEKQLVGKVYKDNDELDEAFKGKLVTEISTLDNDEKSEHVALGDSGKVIESYIPILSHCPSKACSSRDNGRSG